MADTRYALGKEKHQEGSISYLSDDFRFVLIDLSLYTPDFSATGDEFLDDIPSGAQAAIGPLLTGKTDVGGVIDCDDFTFLTVPAGPPLAAAVMYKDTGSSATSPLILYQDSAGSVTPDGGNINYNINASGLYAN